MRARLALRMPARTSSLAADRTAALEVVWAVVVILPLDLTVSSYFGPLSSNPVTYVTYAKSLVSNGINGVLLDFLYAHVRILGISGTGARMIGASLMIWAR